MKDFYSWYHEEGFTLAPNYPFKECLRIAYEAGTQALKERRYLRDQELTSPYGDNNPPVSDQGSALGISITNREPLPMSNPGDKDYEC